MPVTYEWDVETIDDEDVLDHDHRDTYVEVLKAQKVIEVHGGKTRICLVRDVHNAADSNLEDRQWAYMENGKLPKFFEDVGGYDANRIPQRFHGEVANVS